MASPALGLAEEPSQPPPQSHPQPEPAFAEAQRWIEQVTGKTFGDKNFRSALENGILLCELLNSIKPGLVKKINTLPTPIAGLDNIALFLRGCKELGLKESQLFDQGDLQESSSRITARNLDCSRKLKNVLVTIYWLGKIANCSGSPLNLKEFEGLLIQMRKDTEDIESVKRSIRDSGYIDCWDSERSDSLSPPRHGRDDSFDSLDSFGSRSQQTPSPDVVLRGSSDGRGSDSESDLPHRKLPDVKKDDMSARRTSYSEPKSVVPFNQYLPNKSNQTAYIPAPLRKKKVERDDYRKSWSTAASPLGGERPFSKRHPETIEEEQSESLVYSEEDLLSSRITTKDPSVKPVQTDMSQKDPLCHFLAHSGNKTGEPRNNEKEPEELRKLTRLKQAGIKVVPAAHHNGISQKHKREANEVSLDIILRKENPFLLCYQEQDPGSEDEQDERVPDLEKDDFAVRRARLNQPKYSLPFKHFLGSYTKKDQNEVGKWKKQKKKQEYPRKFSLACMTPHGHRACSLTSKDRDDTESSESVGFQSPGRENIMARRTEAFPKQVEPSVGQFIPVHFSKQPNGEEAATKELLKTEQQVKRFGSRTPVSDDAESLSMFDMRCTDEGAVMQPHSKARHEKLHTIYNQLKEDEDQWQDDLARWKSRRRSASQDLLKKEAERKKMEWLLTGADGSSERRKSIKTYREIVEEKERRERELHEAYKNARSREEADSILQQYIERFTISEAVLERLEMPKILERSHSAEPNSSSPPKDPNPLRYLRQQSLPAPKFTAKVETTIVPISGLDTGVSTGCDSPSSKLSISKALPMVTPKPYSQPKNTQEVLRNFKVDGKISINGETAGGTEERPQRECAPFLFAPSPSDSPKSDSAAALGGGSVEGKLNSSSSKVVLKRLIEESTHREQPGSFTEEAEQTNQKDMPDSEKSFLASDHTESSTILPCANPTVASVEFFYLNNHSSKLDASNELDSTKEPQKTDTGEQKDAEASVCQKVETSETPEQGGSLIFSLLKTLPETSQVVLQSSASQVSIDGGKSTRFGCWSWDPEEERKRQERWQQAQELLLQERYQKEQNKLQKEWEKAQKEVEEEERKYYEEERKIIEDTVVPFMLTSSSAEPLSTSSMTDGNRSMNVIDMSNSEEDNQNEDTKLSKLIYEQDCKSFSKNKECEPQKENRSTVNKEVYLKTTNRRQNEQDYHGPEGSSPSKMTLPLHLDAQLDQQLSAEENLCISDFKQKDSPMEHNLGLPISSAKEIKRASSQERSRTVPSSPCSPTVQSHSSNSAAFAKDPLEMLQTELMSGLEMASSIAMIVTSDPEQLVSQQLCDKDLSSAQRYSARRNILMSPRAESGQLLVRAQPMISWLFSL